MQTKSLYGVLGLKFQDKFFDVVLCENPNLEFKNAKDILNANKERFTANDSRLTICLTDKQEITTVLQFVGPKTIESIRGATIRTLNVEDKPMYDKLVDQVRYNCKYIKYIC